MAAWVAANQDMGLSTSQLVLDPSPSTLGLGISELTRSQTDWGCCPWY